MSHAKSPKDDSCNANVEISDDIIEAAIEQVDLAVGLMAECKSELSLANLANVIFLLNQVLDELPVAHALYSDAVSYILSASCLQLAYTGKAKDLAESFNLVRKFANPFHANPPASIPARNEYEDVEELISMFELAKDSLESILKSVSLDSLNTVVFLLQTSLATLESGIHPKRIAALVSLSIALYNRFHHLHDSSDLDTAISCLREAAYQCREPGDSLHSTTIIQLCALLVARYSLTSNADDIQEALESSRALLLIKNKSAIRTQSAVFAEDSSLLDFAVDLCKQSRHSNDIEGLIAAIDIFRELLKAPNPSGEYYCDVAFNLAFALSTRFSYTNLRDDQNEAIILYREVVKVQPPPCHIGSLALNNLANALVKRFGQQGQHADLEEAIRLLRQAHEHLSGSLLDRATCLNNLATALGTRFEHGGLQDDIDESILLFREASNTLPPVHPDHYIRLQNLAQMLAMRVGYGHHAGDVEETISCYRQIIELKPLPHPDGVQALSLLANTLLKRYSHWDGQLSDLEEAILLQKQALEHRPPSHPDRFRSLGDLATMLQTRFDYGGHVDDINEAISLHRQHLELQPLGPATIIQRAFSLINLANALWSLADRGHQRSHDEAIALYEEALEHIPTSHHGRSVALCSLAGALVIKYQQNGHNNNIDRAISLYKQASELTSYPSHKQSDLDNNLATAMLFKIQHETYIPGCLDEIVSLFRRALDLRPPPHADRCASLNGLANALLIRFREEKARGDLLEGVSRYTEALDICSPHHPSKSWYFKNLGLLYMEAELNFGPEEGHLERAMSSFAAASQCLQSNSQRLVVSKTWAAFADEHKHCSAGLAYDTSLKALSQMASLNLDLHSRQRMLHNSSDGLAREAARYAIRHNLFDKAIEYLEAGRAVSWTQVIRVRSPFDSLQGIAPELSERLCQVAAELERGSHRDTYAGIFDNRSQMAIDAETSQLKRLNDEWEEALGKARTLEGFEDFLLPRRFVSLQAAAYDCPVVMLVPNYLGSDCLIMLSTTVHHIPLSGLTTSDLSYLVSLIKMASSQSTVSRTLVENADLTSAATALLRTFFLQEEERASRPAGTSVIPSDTVFKNVLKVLWDCVVHPIIQCLDLKKSNDPSKLQKLRWCSTGLFTFLPIHAAGCYDPEIGVECASDYFISSHVPTIDVLLHGNAPAFKATPSTESMFNMMAVVDTKRLSASKLELQKIKARVPVDCLSELGVPGRPAHVDAVYAGLPTAGIVHFACHGRQNTSNPLRSALLLDDGELTIAKIMQQPLPNGSLAFLCACETAMGDANTPDEALSLGASLLFSGFRSVVATMWKMMDADGPAIVDTFYEELFRGPGGSPDVVLDVSRSAHALHIAVKKLRLSGVEFRRWVPFVHLGK